MAACSTSIASRARASTGLTLSPTTSAGRTRRSLPATRLWSYSRPIDGPNACCAGTINAQPARWHSNRFRVIALACSRMPMWLSAWPCLRAATPPTSPTPMATSSISCIPVPARCAPCSATSAIARATTFTCLARSCIASFWTARASTSWCSSYAGRWRYRQATATASASCAWTRPTHIATFVRRPWRRRTTRVCDVIAPPAPFTRIVWVSATNARTAPSMR